MLFASEQLIVSATVYKLTENTYTISNQYADYAYFTFTGGNIKVRYDGINDGTSNVQTLGETDVPIYKLESREQIKGFRFYISNGNPVLDIQYIMLEWSNYRRITLPKLKMNSVRKSKSHTQKIDFGTANFQLKRVSNRLLHEFNFESFWIRGMKDENEIHGFFHIHQGDVPFYLFANKFSIVEYPTLIDYGDGVKEQFFLPARFIKPFSCKIFFDGIEVKSYSLNESSGLLSFITAPPKNVLITGTFSHYYKCVFQNDEVEDTLIERDNVLLDRKYKLMEVTP